MQQSRSRRPGQQETHVERSVLVTFLLRPVGDHGRKGSTVLPFGDDDVRCGSEYVRNGEFGVAFVCRGVHALRVGFP